ncbi:hypothetical protein YT1_p10071 (plasmid) [Rhodococcus ruber]|nr:hypothetical protein YT1_p10071 [Rhodococcus ruber]
MLSTYLLTLVPGTDISRHPLHRPSSAIFGELAVAVSQLMC